MYGAKESHLTLHLEMRTSYKKLSVSQTKATGKYGNTLKTNNVSNICTIFYIFINML
jgi:hypothetical protein